GYVAEEEVLTFGIPDRTLGEIEAAREQLDFGVLGYEVVEVRGIGSHGSHVRRGHLRRGGTRAPPDSFAQPASSRRRYRSRGAERDEAWGGPHRKARERRERVAGRRWDDRRRPRSLAASSGDRS